MAKRRDEAVRKLSDSHIIRRVLLADLLIDRMEDGGYQRGLKSNHKRIAANLNKSAVGVLHVGNRGEGGMWLIDGQQRREALLLNGITEWDAVVLMSSGREYEAGIYAMLNGKDRKGLTKTELFWGQIAAKDPIALAVRRAVESVGWHVKGGTGGAKIEYGQIACVGTLYRQCSMSGGEGGLTRSLSLLKQNWPGQNETITEPIVGGMCQFVRVFGEQIDEGVLSRAMGEITPREVLLDSMNALTSNRSTEVFKRLTEMYNRKQRSRPKKLKLVKHDESEEVA